MQNQEILMLVLQRSCTYDISTHRGYASAVNYITVYERQMNLPTCTKSSGYSWTVVTTSASRRLYQLFR